MSFFGADDGRQMVCDVCGTDSFTLDGGFYYCDGCGERIKGHRETEIEYQDAPLVNIKKSQKKAERTKREGKAQREHRRKLHADPHLCERALTQDDDFPAYLSTIGTRLCTATKLVAKMATVLTEEPFRLPKRCVHFSRLILFSYFREANVAFCDDETAKDPQDAFCPLVKRTKPELNQLHRERETRAKERRAQRRRERIEQSTVWEQLTRTFTAGDNDDDESDDGNETEAQEEPISLFQRVTTSLSIKVVNMAAVLYLGIDLLLCIVFMAVQMVGARWVQLSDIFRWYREGRFTVSKAQLCALNFATGWALDNGRSNSEFCAKRLTRCFHVRSIFNAPYCGIQPSSESFRVLSFLNQFVGIPKSIQTAPFKDVLFRLVYNLNLPRAFERQLNTLLAVLPPPLFTDYGAQQLGTGMPIIDKKELLERLLSSAASMGTVGHVANLKIGFISFLRHAFGQNWREGGTAAENLEILKDRQRSVRWNWLPLSSEVNAAALVLFALKLFFGLDAEGQLWRDHRQRLKDDDDGSDLASLQLDREDGDDDDDDEVEDQHRRRPAMFNLAHWLLQLQLRTHCWQGTTVQMVLAKDFSACQLERSNPEVPYRRPVVGSCLGGSRLFNRNRKQPFVGCVPNVLHNNVQPRLFEGLFPGLHRLPVTPSVLMPISNDELYAPLQHQCALNRPLFDIVNRQHRNETEQTLVEQLDQRNTKIFFRNFYNSSLASYLPPVVSHQQMHQNGQDNPLQKMFPCANKYTRIHHPKIRPSRLSATVAKPLRRMKWVRAIFVASEYAMPTPFRLLLRHLALCVGDWEEVVYMAFLVVEGMFIELSRGTRHAMMREEQPYWQQQQQHDFFPSPSSSASSSDEAGDENDQEGKGGGEAKGGRMRSTVREAEEEEEDRQLFVMSSSSSGEDEGI